MWVAHDRTLEFGYRRCIKQPASASDGSRERFDSPKKALSHTSTSLSASTMIPARSRPTHLPTQRASSHVPIQVSTGDDAIVATVSLSFRPRMLRYRDTLEFIARPHVCSHSRPGPLKPALRLLSAVAQCLGSRS